MFDGDRGVLVEILQTVQGRKLPYTVITYKAITNFRQVKAAIIIELRTINNYFIVIILRIFITQLNVAWFKCS
jgi:hypothetical protein